MEYTAWAVSLLILFSLWIYTSFMAKTFPILTNKRILLLIAHPDDEAMFFAPAVQALSSRSLGNQVKILCLSTGNADGLGNIRAKELQKSATILGLDGTMDVLQVDDPNFPDGPKAWDPQMIAKSLSGSLITSSSKADKSKPPEALIDVMITFDKTGVSSHPNHRSCYDGAVVFMTELMRGRAGWEPPITLYTLNSVNIFRKYSHIFDSLLTIIVALFLLLRRGGGKGKGKGRGHESAGTSDPSLLLFVNNIPSWYAAQRAMVSGHWSQMVWFRWGWIGLGRYLLINDLHKVKAA